MTQVSINCRLCGNMARKIFEKTILFSHQVAYFECESCHSLMTENPYWLDEAYRSNISSLDTGAVFRNLNNFAASFLFCEIFSIKNVLEYGASDGLLSRFLRDQGINCLASDKYGSLTYIQGFTAGENYNPELVVMYEVVEHFSDPAEEFEKIFSTNPKFVLFSTGVYQHQGSEWDYLVPEGGQHIFFYSAEGLMFLAKKYGYNVTSIGPFLLFFSASVDQIRSKLVSADFCFKGWVFKAIKGEILSRMPVGIMQDMETIRRTFPSC